MTTARELIIDALEDLVVQADEAPIEASEAETALRILNNLMAELEAQGIELGYTKVTKLTETVSIPDGALLGVSANLATRLAPKYLTGEIPNTLIQAARRGYLTLVNIAVNVASSGYPDTLSSGAGNDEDVYGLNNLVNLLATNAGVELTIAAQNTPVVIGSTWIEETSSKFTSTVGGKFTYIGYGETINISAIVTAVIASGTDDCTFYYYKNGVQIAASATTQELSTTATSVSLVWTIDVNTNDYIEFYVENDDTDVDISVHQAILRIS